MTLMDFGNGGSLLDCGWGVRLYHGTNVFFEAIDVSSGKELLIHIGSIHRDFKF
jgi:hypothetical protein